MQRIRATSFCTILVAVSVAAACSTREAADPGSRSTLVTAARLLDVRSGSHLANSAILIDGDRIARVGAQSDLERAAPGATRMDLGDVTLLPGLIDAHAHVLASMDGLGDSRANILNAIKLGPDGRVQLGSANAKELLDAGFTTVRNVGHAGTTGDVTVRDAINAGTMVGPRLLASGRKITPPGGQGLGVGLPDAVVREEFIPIRGVDQARQAASDLIAAGVDVIKIVVDDEARRLTSEEIAAVTTAAHKARVRVAAHATTAGGIQAAIDGGVDTIEHGDEATDDILRTMRAKGIALVVTPYTPEALLDIYIERPGMSAQERKDGERSALAFADAQAALLRRATQSGVKIVLGSDMWTRYPSKTRGDATKTMLRAASRAGMPPIAVMRAVTIDAADVLGWGDRVGTVEAGRFADIIAVRGDPLSDVAALDRVTVVMKGGRSIRD